MLLVVLLVFVIAIAGCNTLPYAYYQQLPSSLANYQ